MAASAAARQAAFPAPARDHIDDDDRLAFIASCLPGLAYERRRGVDGAVSYPFFGGALLTAFGLDAASARTDPQALFARIHPGDRAAFEATVAQASASRAGYALDLRWIDDAGGIVWTRNLATASEHPDGTRWMCLSVEITELKETQAAVRAADCERSDFLATMSHELRSPLHGILGYNELLLTTELSAKQRRYADLGSEASRSLLTIVNEALEFAEVEGTEADEVSEPFDLPARLATVTRAFEPAATVKGIGLALKLGPSLPRAVLGDAQRLGQVLTNILSNAVKYTDRGGVEVVCDGIGGGTLGTRIRIEVRDTGIGIPKDMVPKLFGRFSQASRHQTRRRGGSGLGLSIVKAQVARMGGTVAIETEEHVGTTVRVELALPVATTAEVHPFARPDRRPVPSSPKTVLFVDDTPAGADLVREFLHDTPVTVRAAASGEEALDMVASESMDLVFMDLTLPGTSGVETTKLIRALGGKRGAVPIIGLTGQASATERELCRSNGFSDVVTKPFNRAELAEMIAKWS